MPKVETDPVFLPWESAVSGSSSQLVHLTLVPELLILLAQRHLGLCLGVRWVILKPIYAVLQEIAQK